MYTSPTKDDIGQQAVLILKNSPRKRTEMYPTNRKKDNKNFPRKKAPGLNKITTIKLTPIQSNNTNLLYI